LKLFLGGSYRYLNNDQGETTMIMIFLCIKLNYEWPLGA